MSANREQTNCLFGEIPWDSRSLSSCRPVCRWHTREPIVCRPSPPCSNLKIESLAFHHPNKQISKYGNWMRMYKLQTDMKCCVSSRYSHLSIISKPYFHWMPMNAAFYPCRRILSHYLTTWVYQEALQAIRVCSVQKLWKWKTCSAQSYLKSQM